MVKVNVGSSNHEGRTAGKVERDQPSTYILDTLALLFPSIFFKEKTTMP
jgi:hypothetical protein